MVPGSIPGGVTGFFNDMFPSDQTTVLGSTQPLVKMSTRNILGGKGGQCVRLTTYHHAVPLSRNLETLTSGPAWPVMGKLYLYLYTYGAKCWECVLKSLSNDKFKLFIKEEHQYWKGLCSSNIQRTHKTSFPVTPLWSSHSAWWLQHFSSYGHYHAKARMYLCWLQSYGNSSLRCSRSKTCRNVF